MSGDPTQPPALKNYSHKMRELQIFRLIVRRTRPSFIKNKKFYKKCKQLTITAMELIYTQYKKTELWLEEMHCPKKIANL